MSRRRLTLGVLAVALVVSAPPAAAGDAAPLVTKTVQRMELPATVTESADPPAAEEEDGEETGETGASEDPEARVEAPDTPVTPAQTAGVAGAQPAEERRDEYRRSCDADALWPVSRLAAIGGSVVTDRQDRWPWILLVVAALIFVPLAVLKGRRRRQDDSPPPGALETAATVVGIAVALPALAGLFFPGVGVKHHPPAKATMAVREVQARVTRGEFVRRAIPPEERPRLTRIDRREVGHVVWLELGLAGFRGDDLMLTWASYGQAGGYALIPQTDDAIRLEVGKGNDAETRFVPIWVGLPKQKFQVRFRLIDVRRKLRQVTRTDDMRGSRLRYTCDRAA